MRKSVSPSRLTGVAAKGHDHGNCALQETWGSCGLHRDNGNGPGRSYNRYSGSLSRAWIPQICRPPPTCWRPCSRSNCRSSAITANVTFGKRRPVPTPPKAVRGRFRKRSVALSRARLAFKAPGGLIAWRCPKPGIRVRTRRARRRRTDELAIEQVDDARPGGADVRLIGRREFLRSRLHADAVRAASLGGRLRPRRLVCRPCSKYGDEEPDCKGEHCRCGAGDEAVLEPRREQRHVRNARFVEDEVDLPDGDGGAAVGFHDALLRFRCGA